MDDESTGAAAGGSASAIPEGKPTSAARVTISQIMDSHDTNLLGTVHGGVIMKLVDSVAGVVAARHSGGQAVTAALDEMAFLIPVRVGDVVHVHSQVNWAGKSSMEIGVQVLADRWDESVPAVQVATAYLAFVAIDEQGRPRPVPPVLPVSADDERRYREAEIRRDHRLARRRAILDSRSRG